MKNLLFLPILFLSAANACTQQKSIETTPQGAYYTGQYHNYFSEISDGYWLTLFDGVAPVYVINGVIRCDQLAVRPYLSSAADRDKATTCRYY